MGELSEQSRRRVVRIDMEIARLAHGRRGRIGIGEYEAGEPPGEGRFADPLRAADKPGVGEAAVAIGRKQFRFRVPMAEQRHDVARMARAGKGVGFREIVALTLPHARTASTAPAGSSRPSTADQIAAST